MKKLLSIFVALLLISCEEVVKVDLDTAAPRLVIDASINWEKGTDGSQQSITLTTTTGYYSTTIPTVSNATVFITDDSNTVFNFNEEVSGSGEYVCSNFIPKIDKNYTLTVNYNGQTYTASEKMIAVPEITGVTQRNDAGVSGKNIEVQFYFQDDGSEKNFYLTEFITPVNAFPIYHVLNDQFTQGNEMFGIYTNENLKSGNTINFSLYGISDLYYNYMNILLGIAGTNGGNPFQPPPSTARGNIINQTHPDNYALGFFRLCETDKMQYLVQ